MDRFVQIIDREERLPLVVKDEHGQPTSSKIFYRRLTEEEKRLLRNRHTDEKGNVDRDALSREAAQLATLDWEGIKGRDGKFVKFSPELVDKLPGPVLMQLALAIRGTVCSVSEEERGNCEASSESGPGSQG